MVRDAPSCQSPSLSRRPEGMGHGALYGHHQIPSLHRQMFFQMQILSLVRGGRFLHDLVGQAMVPCDSSLQAHEHPGGHDPWLYGKAG